MYFIAESVSYLNVNTSFKISFYKKVLYMIDVSQSVEHDHPHALEFLRKDCENVVDFFKKSLGQAAILTLRELFDFVVKDSESLRKELLEKIPQSSNTIPIICHASLVHSHTSTDDLDILLESYLCQIHKELVNRPIDFFEMANVQVEEEVFKNSYIPRTMEELMDVEKEIKRAKSGATDNV
jgi:RIO kinase 1